MEHVLRCLAIPRCIEVCIVHGVQQVVSNGNRVEARPAYVFHLPCTLWHANPRAFYLLLIRPSGLISLRIRRAFRFDGIYATGLSRERKGQARNDPLLVEISVSLARSSRLENDERRIGTRGILIYRHRESYRGSSCREHYLLIYCFSTIHRGGILLERDGVRWMDRCRDCEKFSASDLHGNMIFLQQNIVAHLLRYFAIYRSLEERIARRDTLK